MASIHRQFRELQEMGARFLFNYLSAKENIYEQNMNKLIKFQDKKADFRFIKKLSTMLCTDFVDKKF